MASGETGNPVLILTEQEMAGIRLRQRYQTHYTFGTHRAEISYQTHTTTLTLAVSREGRHGFIYCASDDLAVLLQNPLSGTDIRLLPDNILLALISAWLDKFSAGLTARGIIKEEKTITGYTAIFSGSIFIFSDINLIHSHLKLIPPSIPEIPLKVRISSADFCLPACEILSLCIDDLIVSPLPDNNIPVSVYYRHYPVATGTLFSNKVRIRKMTSISRRKTPLSPLKSTLSFGLADTEITLDELAGLKPDSLIELTDNSEHYIRVFCDGEYIADGILVSFHQRLAVQIKEFVTSAENTRTKS